MSDIAMRYAVAREALRELRESVKTEEQELLYLALGAMMDLLCAYATSSFDEWHELRRLIQADQKKAPGP